MKKLIMSLFILFLTSALSAGGFIVSNRKTGITTRTAMLVAHSTNKSVRGEVEAISFSSSVAATIFIVANPSLLAASTTLAVTPISVSSTLASKNVISTAVAGTATLGGKDIYSVELTPGEQFEVEGPMLDGLKWRYTNGVVKGIAIEATAPVAANISVNLRIKE